LQFANKNQRGYVLNCHENNVEKALMILKIGLHLMQHNPDIS